MEWKNTAQVYHSTKQNSFILIAIIIIFIIIIYSLLFNKHRFRGDKLVVPLVPSSDKWGGFYQEGYLDLSNAMRNKDTAFFSSISLLLLLSSYICMQYYSCVYSYYHYLIRENLRDYFLQLCHKHLHTAKWTEKMTHRSFMKSEMK